jgi:hypothetical protein
MEKIRNQKSEARSRRLEHQVAVSGFGFLIYYDV